MRRPSFSDRVPAPGRGTCRALGAFVVGARVVLSSACGGSGDSPESTDSDSGFDAAAYLKGKTIQVIVTHSAGGGIDLYGRFIANRLGERNPGHLRISVTNKGGAGGTTDVVRAPEEELVLGVTSQGSALYLAAEDPEAGFVPSDVHFVGATGGEPRSIIGYGDITKAFNSFDEAVGKPEPVFLGAGTVGGPVDVVSDAFMIPWLCQNLQVSCKLFSVADDDSSDLNLMIARGEMNLQSGTLACAIRDHPEKLADGGGARGSSAGVHRYRQRSRDTRRDAIGAERRRRRLRRISLSPGPTRRTSTRRPSRAMKQEEASCRKAQHWLSLLLVQHMTTFHPNSPSE